MATRTKAESPVRPRRAAGNKVVLYTLIEPEQQQALRVLGFMRQVPLADLVREALDAYLAENGPSAADVESMVKLIRRSVRAK